MKKVLVSGISAAAFGIIALIFIPKESKADFPIEPPCPCWSQMGTKQVFKVTRFGPPGSPETEISLGCMTPAQIGALPPLPIGPGYVQFYRIGCGTEVGGPL